MEDYVIKTLILSVISWASLFMLIFKVVLPNKSFDFCSRIVSIIHACLAVTLATLSVKDWNCPVCPLASKSSPQQMIIIAITIGYMIYDMLCCLIYKQLKFEDLLHHLVCIVGSLAAFAYQKSGSEMIGALWITEISGPLLHLRELLKELGYKDTSLNLLVDICFAITFSIARMIGGTYLTYLVVTSNIPILMKAMTVGLLVISAFWFYKIIRIVMYKLSKRRKK